MHQKLPKKMDMQMELFLLNKVWHSRKKLPEIIEERSEYERSHGSEEGVNTSINHVEDLLLIDE